MGAERKTSLTIAQFLDTFNWDQDSIGDLSSQLIAGNFSFGPTEEEGSAVARKDSGAYMAALLERVLQGQMDKAEFESAIADLPACLADDAIAKGLPAQVVGGSTVEEAKCAEKDNAAVAGEWGPAASEEMSFKKRAHSQGDDESEVSDEQVGTSSRTKRQRQVAASNAEGVPDGEVETVSRAVIEPKISKVDVDVIPAKEARRVLNNRKSARKSYIRKKEKMKTMEERVARYEVQFATVEREFRRLMTQYERVLEENLMLKARLGHNVQQQQQQHPPSQSHLNSGPGQYWS